MRLLLCCSAFLLVAASCKKDKPIDEPDPPAPTPQLKVVVQPKFGSADLALDQTYTLDNGFKIQFTEVKFYVTDLRNGATGLTDAARYDLREYGTKLFQTSGDYTQFTALTGNIGVGAAINHNDPSAFPTTSPLNIMNAGGQHWAWNTGYIFIILEAKADTIPDATENFDHLMTYHVGTDDYLGTLNFPAVTWSQDGSDANLRVSAWRLDLKTVFDHPTAPIDITTEFITHSSGSQAALTAKVLANFEDALTAP